MIYRLRKVIKFINIVIIILLFIFIDYAFYYNINYKKVTIHKLSLYSINYFANIKGNFTLGSDNIDSTQSYVAFIKYKSGGFQKIKIDMNTVIFQGNYNPTYIYSTCKTGLFHLDTKCTDKEYISQLYVPKGTVIPIFKIN